MTKIALTPNAAGSGTFTIAAPNSNSNRTLTLPDSAGTLVTDATLPGLVPELTQVQAEDPTSTVFGLTSGQRLAQAVAANAPPPSPQGWQPWNGTNGLIWSFPVDGAVSTVTSPDFEDGYEYLFVGNAVQSSSSGNLRMNLFRETSGAYAGAVNVSITSLSGVSIIDFRAEVEFARMVRRNHAILGGESNLGTDVALSYAGSTSRYWADAGARPVVRHATAQKILRVQFSVSSGNITGSGSEGQIYMYRRGSAI